MAKAAAYEPVLSAKASSALVGLSRPKQRKIIELLFRLAQHPGQLGDYSTRDDRDRDIQHLRLGDRLVSFWADHAVAELRITAIEEL